MLPPNETEMQVIAQELCRIKGMDPYEISQDLQPGPSGQLIMKNTYAYEIQYELYIKPLLQALEAIQRVMEK